MNQFYQQNSAISPKNWFYSFYQAHLHFLLYGRVGIKKTLEGANLHYLPPPASLFISSFLLKGLVSRSCSIYSFNISPILSIDLQIKLSILFCPILGKTPILGTRSLLKPLFINRNILSSLRTKN